MSALPNFLIIGAGSCGTTSLYHYLKQHPQIFMSPQKETRFFAFEGQDPDFKGPNDKRFAIVTDIETYLSRFNGVSNEVAVGEASANYLHSADAPKRIYHHIPKVKLIAILRDPVERAYSNYLTALKFGETKNFTDSLKAEPERISKNWSWFWHYKYKGYYYEHLKRYYEIFNESQIKIICYEDFQDEPLKTMEGIFNFLKVEESFIPDMSVRHNKTTHPRSYLLHKLLEKPHSDSTWGKSKGIRSILLRANLTSKRPPLEHGIRKAIIKDYQDDILKLQDLIKKDLSSWLQVKA